MPGERGSVCVGASAGSGKTTRLVREYFDHLEDGIGTQGILALTFNDEAAANMRDRIRERALEQGDEELFDQLNWAQVQTFHSFCAQVLREFHLQADVPSDFTVLEEIDLQLLLNEAWEEMMVTGEGEFRAKLVKLIASHGRQFKESMFFLYERRARAEESLKAMSDRDTFRRNFRLMAEEYLDGLLDCLECDELNGALEVLQLLADRYADEDGDTAANYLFRIRPLIVQTVEGDRNERLLAYRSLLHEKGRRGMGSVKTLKGDKEVLNRAYEVLRVTLEETEFELENLEFDLDVRSLDIAVEHLMDLRDVFLRFVSLVNGWKQERHALDFNDLLIRAQGLLDPAVPGNLILSSLQRRYRRILVDEYQDTDVPQDRIVRALLGGDMDKLFVVGDGKQSIYLFRGADVTIFKGMLRFVVAELMGRREELDSNYRSASGLVTFVNLLFSRLMQCEENDWEFRYEGVDPYRLDDDGSVTIVQVAGGGRDDKMAMARAVADQIQRMVNGDGRPVTCKDADGSKAFRSPGYGDITILLRARTNLRYYESVLAERGIPFSVEKGVGFFQRQEILDIGNLVGFLCNQMDDISLYGTLRSPYFGLSDGKLLQVVRSSPYGHLFSRLKGYAGSHPEDEQISRALEVLSGLLKRCRTIPVAETLGDAIQGTGILGIYAGMFNGRQMIANVEQLMDKVRRREQEGFFTIFDLRDWLDLSADDMDKEGQAQMEAAGDAVRIMTVHASKGLEFPIVILPETHTRPRDESDTVAMTGLGLFSMVPSADPMVRYAPVPLRVADIELQAKSEAQNLRLFYVAATRAKDHFVMLGTRARKEGVWAELKDDNRDWFSLSMNALDLCYAEDGPRELNGPDKPQILLETYEDEGDVVSGTIPEGCVVPSEFGAWKIDFTAIEYQGVKVVLPSSVDSKIADDFKGGRWSETKRLLLSRGMDAASYGTLVHEVLRGRSAEALLKRQGLRLSPEEMRSAVLGLEGIRERFMSSEVMRNRKEGGMDLQELPFELREGDTLYMGVIDRLVEMRDGSWALIDYKTVSHGDDVAGIGNAYSEQLRVYEEAVINLVGTNPKRYLFLTEYGFLIEL